MPSTARAETVSTTLALIVGLGNPGTQYAHTRHNAGADFVLRLAAHCGAGLKPEPKFRALMARVQLAGEDLRLLLPETFMNLSGQSVGAAAQFYKLPPERILVAHDELDLPAGEARFKRGGGHGGHNGLRDIIAALGNKPDFHRLRIGIGHPGSSERVTPWVLSRPDTEDRMKIDACMEEAVAVMPAAVRGEWPIAMNRLHSFRAS